MRERGEAFQYKVPEFSDLVVLKEAMSKVALLPPKENKTAPATKAGKPLRDLQNLTRRVQAARRTVDAIQAEVGAKKGQEEEVSAKDQEQPAEVEQVQKRFIDLEGPEIKHLNDETIWSELDGRPKKRYLPRFHSHSCKNKPTDEQDEPQDKAKRHRRYDRPWALDNRSRPARNSTALTLDRQFQSSVFKDKKKAGSKEESERILRHVKAEFLGQAVKAMQSDRYDKTAEK